MPVCEISFWGRSLPCPASYSHHAGLCIELLRQEHPRTTSFLTHASLSIELPGQELSLTSKLFAPCQFEYRASEAGASLSNKLSHPCQFEYKASEAGASPNQQSFLALPDRDLVCRRDHSPALRRMPQLEAREFIHVYFTKSKNDD